MEAFLAGKMKLGAKLIFTLRWRETLLDMDILMFPLLFAPLTNSYYFSCPSLSGKSQKINKFLKLKGHSKLCVCGFASLKKG